MGMCVSVVTWRPPSDVLLAKTMQLSSVRVTKLNGLNEIYTRKKAKWQFVKSIGMYYPVVFLWFLKFLMHDFRFAMHHEVERNLRPQKRQEAICEID